MPPSRNGFTIVELMVVTLILGILAALALPRLSATPDKARLAGIRSDIRNAELAEESYFSDDGRYGSLAEIEAEGFSLSAGVTMRVTVLRGGYAVQASNMSIAAAIKTCSVQVGGSTPALTDGVIACP